MSEKSKIAVVVAWHGAELLIEERWIDADDGDGGMDVRYAFPGGKPETHETLDEAAVRELLEETGVRRAPRDLEGPEIIEAKDDIGHIFSIRLPFGETIQAENIVLWSIADLLEHKKRGKLMPITDRYAERFI